VYPPTTAQDWLFDTGFETPQPGHVFSWTINGPMTWAQNDAANAHTGTGHMTFGAPFTQSAIIYQNTFVPTGPVHEVVFWMKMTTQETTTTNANDTLSINLRNVSTNALIATLATYSNLDAAAFASYSQRTIDVGAYAGQQVKFAIEGHTNG